AADALVTGGGEFAFQPRSAVLAASAADQTEPAGGADRGRKRTAGAAAHRRQQHWMADAEALGQGSAKGHRGLLGPAYSAARWADTSRSMPAAAITCFSRSISSAGNL